ncbi:hypothetical protein SAMN05216228_10468 [Rhizobium tibeticum]|uniref:Uncharacterized protein n=1 Tax=Rhizobium tibeticum TaxID=501024 RepID=A0A1H8VQY6_9HYPH|nr:hypothetical protein RTCCBAU85039_6175 [Rhizobium tibeticum]SEP17647.1 hypothetical protein SAMN05216228_10468 [Rhizobium tibeticum]
MAVAKAGDDRTAPVGPKHREGRRGEAFLFARNDGDLGPRSTCRVGWVPAGDESFGAPLREYERGVAALRPDMPHRAREWSPVVKGKGYGNGGPHPEIPANGTSWVGNLS